jgi:hypothetical protein
LNPFLSGQGEPLASLAHLEPTGTANYLERGGKGLQTVARRDWNDWIINGKKVCVWTVLAKLLTSFKMWATNFCDWDDRGVDPECVVCRYSQDGKDQGPELDPADAIIFYS